MRGFVWIGVMAVLAVAGGVGNAQEEKPVPKDSMRLVLSGCTKGYVFTTGPRTPEQTGNFELAQGTHLRMNGPKKLINDIKAHEGSMVEITGLMKKGQFKPDGINVGGGVRITPGPNPTSGSVAGNVGPGLMSIDVEGWRQVVGDCPANRR